MSENLARLLRDLPALHETEKPVSFDPVQTTVLQKLVRAETLQEGVTVAKEDFFAAIVCLDYFTEVIAARTTVLHDVAIVVDELDKMADYLDPDLELLVRWLGVYIARDLKGEALFKEGSMAGITRRHDKGNAAAASGGAAADLYHAAVGRFVRDQTRRPEIHHFLDGVAGRNDLRAALLVDAILVATGAPAPAALAQGAVLPALAELLAQLSREAPAWSLRAHVDRLKARL